MGGFKIYVFWRGRRCKVEGNEKPDRIRAYPEVPGDSYGTTCQQEVELGTRVRITSNLRAWRKKTSRRPSLQYPRTQPKNQ